MCFEARYETLFAQLLSHKTHITLQSVAESTFASNTLIWRCPSETASPALCSRQHNVWRRQSRKGRSSWLSEVCLGHMRSGNVPDVAQRGLSVRVSHWHSMNINERRRNKELQNGNKLLKVDNLELNLGYLSSYLSQALFIVWHSFPSKHFPLFVCVFQHIPGVSPHFQSQC